MALIWNIEKSYHTAISSAKLPSSESVKTWISEQLSGGESDESLNDLVCGGDNLLWYL